MQFLELHGLQESRSEILLNLVFYLGQDDLEDVSFDLLGIGRDHLDLSSDPITKVSSRCKEPGTLHQDLRPTIVARKAAAAP